MRFAAASESYYIVDISAPVDEVFGVLVGELLAVVGVALVGVVDEDFAVDAVDEGFPDQLVSSRPLCEFRGHNAHQTQGAPLAVFGGPEVTTVETYSQV